MNQYRVLYAVVFCKFVELLTLRSCTLSWLLLKDLSILLLNFILS